MNRFDIAEAWYLYLSETHEGQWSEKYERLSKLLTWFNPRPNLEVETLSENGRNIYETLCEASDAL